MGMPPTIESTIADFTNARQCQILTHKGSQIAGPGVLHFAAHAMRGQQIELEAWRTRFPQYTFRPQDGCVALKA